jgi:hypothetical protein
MIKRMSQNAPLPWCTADSEGTFSDDPGDVEGPGAAMVVVVADGETVTVGLALALADADGEGEAEADGEAETEGDGVGFGVAVLVGVGVGVGLGGAVTVNVADAESVECGEMEKLARTVWPPASRWPLGAVSPTLVAVQVEVPTNAALPSDTTPSHENEAPVGQLLPCDGWYVTVALNFCVAVP